MSLLVNFQISYAERIRSKTPNPFWAFKLLGALLVFIIGLVVFFAVIGIIIWSIGFFTNASETGLYQVYFTQADVFFSKIPITNIIYNGFKTLVEVREDPSRIIRSYGWKTDVDENTQNLQLGLRFITPFKTLKQTYLTNEEVTATTTIEISSLEKESNILLSCNVTKDMPPDKESIVQPSEPIKINKNEIKRFPAVCKIPENTFIIPGDGTQVLAKKLRLGAAYDFKTNSYLDIYTMQKSYLDSLITQGIDPFENEINPSLDKSTGQTTPITTYGPMKVILSLQYNQPLTEQGPFTGDNTYLFGLKIEKTSASWQGRLKKINDIYINLPNNFELVDENFQEDYSNQNANLDGRFRRYKLNQGKINELNNQCITYYNSNTVQDCIDLFERGFVIAFTKFRINSLDQSLVRDSIGAEVDYIFEAETLASITYVKSYTTN